jgi:hypothetical protein
MHDGDHPTDDQIKAYCQGSREHAELIEQHIIYCSVCAHKIPEFIRAELAKGRQPIEQ